MIGSRPSKNVRRIQFLSLVCSCILALFPTLLALFSGKLSLGGGPNGQHHYIILA